MSQILAPASTTVVDPEVAAVPAAMTLTATEATTVAATTAVTMNVAMSVATTADTVMRDATMTGAATVDGTTNAAIAMMATADGTATVVAMIVTAILPVAEAVAATTAVTATIALLSVLEMPPLVVPATAILPLAATPMEVRNTTEHVFLLAFLLIFFRSRSVHGLSHDEARAQCATARHRFLGLPHLSWSFHTVVVLRRFIRSRECPSGP